MPSLFLHRTSVVHLNLSVAATAHRPCRPGSTSLHSHGLGPATSEHQLPCPPGDSLPKAPLWEEHLFSLKPLGIGFLCPKLHLRFLVPENRIYLFSQRCPLTPDPRLWTLHPVRSKKQAPYKELFRSDQCGPKTSRPFLTVWTT